MTNRWQNRIVGHGDEDPEQLLASPFNHRIHNRKQAKAAVSSLDHLGWIAEVIVNTTTGHMIDGHLRVGEAISAGETSVPVTYVAITEGEERTAIAVYDAISAMAHVDEAQLAMTTADLDMPDALSDLVADMLGASDLNDAEGAADAAEDSNALTWGYTTFGKKKVPCSTGAVQQLTALLEDHKRAEGTEEGFVEELLSRASSTQEVPA